jgi:phage-related protein
MQFNLFIIEMIKNVLMFADEVLAIIDIVRDILMSLYNTKEYDRKYRK